jgi:hypothetical protein
MGSILRSVCVIAVIAGSSNALAKSDDGTREASAQRRTSITVHPSRNAPGPNASRHCDAWLQKEYRPSGTVVTPQMRCYWR